MWKAFSALCCNFNVKLITNLDISLVLPIKGNRLHSSLTDQRHINCKQEQCICVRMPCFHSEESSSDDSFCLQCKVQCTQAGFKKVPTPAHLITNFAYMLKPHHTRNQYFRAWLDTCVDANVMPGSLYRLVFKDPELKKLAPSTMGIGTYTTDTVKIVGSCIFYLVHLNTGSYRSDIYCWKWWKCLALMLNNQCVWINTTKNKTWLLTSIRRQSVEWLFTAQGKIGQCLHRKMQFPNWL